MVPIVLKITDDHMKGVNINFVSEVCDVDAGSGEWRVINLTLTC